MNFISNKKNFHLNYQKQKKPLMIACTSFVDANI